MTKLTPEEDAYLRTQMKETVAVSQAARITPIEAAAKAIKEAFGKELFAKPLFGDKASGDWYTDSSAGCINLYDIAKPAVLAFLRAAMEDEELRGNVGIEAYAACHPGEAAIQALIDHVEGK